MSTKLDNVASKFRIQVGLDIKGDWEDRPLDFLRELRKCTSTLVDSHERRAVELARAKGHTWEDIGLALGVSRQAAWGRFASDE